MSEDVNKTGQRGSLFSQWKEEWVLPEVEGEKCVHAHFAGATCNHCVEICPINAWVIDDEMLGIDTSRCDGCGICVAACPESAISSGLFPAFREKNSQQRFLFLSCTAGLSSTTENQKQASQISSQTSPSCSVDAENAGFSESNTAAKTARERFRENFQENAVQEETATSQAPISREGIVPCIHAISDRELLKYYRKGYRYSLLRHDACEECPRNPTDSRWSIYQRIEKLNRLFEQRNQAQFSIYKVSLEAWEKYLQEMSSAVLTPALDRRDFLRRAMTVAVEKGLEKVEELQPEETIGSVPLLPETADPDNLGKHYALFVPVMDEQKCCGCDACLRLCPHDVIRFSQEEHRYQLDAACCTGCKLCVDVCDDDAIRIEEAVEQTQLQVPLWENRCKRCGVTYHYPENSPSLEKYQTYCRICAQWSGHQKLFQVYDD